MILFLDECHGKALDWVYQIARNSDTSDMRVENGGIVIYLCDDYFPPGWYLFKSINACPEAEEHMRERVRKTFGEGPFVVPTDLCSPKFSHIKHEIVSDGYYLFY